MSKNWLLWGLCLVASALGCDSEDPEPGGTGGVLILPMDDMGPGGAGGGQGGQGGGEGGMGGGEGGAGGMVDTCGRRAQVGDACPEDPSCCARGSYCYQGGNQRVVNTCVRECDADGIGCDTNELCLADGEERNYCRPSDNCVPGRENETCDLEGVVSCVRTGNITQCIAHGALTRAVGAGEDCTSLTSACQPGLVCEFGICRQPCSDAGSCAQGEECIDFTRRVGSEWRFCMATCDIYQYSNEFRAANEPQLPGGGEGGMMGAGGAGGMMGGEGGMMGGEGGMMGAGGAGGMMGEGGAGGGMMGEGGAGGMMGEGGAGGMMGEGGAGGMMGEGGAGGGMMGEGGMGGEGGGNPPPPPIEECADGLVCEFLFDHIDGLSAGSCVERDPPGLLRNGDPCSPSAAPHGDCTPDHLCSRLSADGDNICIPYCDRDNLQLCEGAQACVEAFDNVQGAGICLGECDVFLGTGCAPGQTCGLGNVGRTAEREDQVIGFCQDNPMPGNQGTGEPCVRDEETGANNCAPGHLCQDFGNDFDECIKLCQENPPEGGACPEGYDCRTGVFNGLDTVGICAR